MLGREYQTEQKMSLCNCLNPSFTHALNKYCAQLWCLHHRKDSRNWQQLACFFPFPPWPHTDTARAGCRARETLWTIPVPLHVCGDYVMTESYCSAKWVLAANSSWKMWFGKGLPVVYLTLYFCVRTEGMKTWSQKEHLKHSTYEIASSININQPEQLAILPIQI